MPGKDPAKGARDTGRTGRGIGEGPADRDRQGGNRSTSGKKAGNATVADHMIATGQIDVPSIGPNGMAQGNYASQDDAYTDFGRAVGQYDTRGLLGKVADFFGGSWFDQQEPISQNPRTFAKGTYHTSTNPIGALAGVATPYGLGAITAPIAGGIYNWAGGKNVFHGGYSQPDTGIYDDPSGGWGQASSGGLFDGGGNPSNPQANRGRESLLPTQPGVSQPAPVSQAAQPDVQQSQERKRRMYALGMNGVPGPTPYNYQTAKWL